MKWKISSFSIVAVFLLFSSIRAENDPNPGSNMPEPTEWVPQKSENGKMLLRGNVTEGTLLHLWLRANQEGQLGQIFVAKFSSAGNASIPMSIASTNESDSRWFEYFEVAIEFEGRIEMSWSTESTNVSYIYAFEPEQVLDEGIRPIYISPIATLPSDLTKFHFRPPLGWINDPNGFSRSNDGLYHLFYQHHPHTQMWWEMHWGHAVSRDLVHWVDQPIFLRPTKDQMNGGIFSGSAFPAEEGLRIYYADRKDGRTPLEFQRSVLTKDLIRPIGPKVTAIADRPAAIVPFTTQDFRDPNVFVGPKNQFLMLLGSKVANKTGGLILLMRHNEQIGAEPKGWEYMSILHNETRWKIDAAECPGLLPLGNPQKKSTLWAMIYGAQNSVDGNGRGFLSPIHLGTFDGKKFASRSEKLLDFVSGSYGYQGFYDEMAGESVLIAWLANWPDRDPNVDFPTTMTVPRVLKLSSCKNKVLISPHPKLTKLRGEMLNSATLKEFQPVELPKGTADIEAEFKNGNGSNAAANISLNLNHSVLGNSAIRIVVSENQLEMKLSWKNSSFQFVAPNIRTTSLRVLIDLRSVEVFANDGEAVGTTRIPSNGQIQSVQFVGANSGLKKAKIWTMKSTQQ